MDLFQIIRLGQTERLGKKLTDIQLLSTNEEGQNLLHEAVAYNQIEMGKNLIKEGIQIDHQDKDGQSPLHYASIHRNPEFAKLLLENSANPNLVDNHGNGPLWAAVYSSKGFYDLVKILVKAGADPRHANNYNDSPLDFALQIGDARLVEVLQEHVARPVQKEGRGGLKT